MLIVVGCKQPTQQCNDSDSNNDPSVKGKVSINREEYELNGDYFDFCSDSQVVQRDCSLVGDKYYLTNTGFFNCSNGCEDGVCLGT